MPDPIVTVCRSGRDPSAVEVTYLSAVAERILTGAGGLESVTHELRGLLDREGESAFNAAKVALPSCVVAGQFSRRASSGLVPGSLTGLCWLDLDDLNNPERTAFEVWESCRSAALLFISPSGEGLKLAVATGNQDPAGHRSAVQYAAGCVARLTGAKVASDSAGQTDIARQAFLAYDARARFRTDFEAISLPPSVQAAANPAPALPAAPDSILRRLEVIERYVGPVSLTGDTAGLAVRGCPAADLHSSPSKPNDLLVHLDQVPGVFCFHTSCRSRLDSLNRRIRSEIACLEAYSVRPSHAAPRHL